MKTSLKELIELNACKSGIERFVKQTGANDDEQYDVASLVGGENNYSDLLWLAGEKLSEERIVRFACDCALINIELIKPYCSDDDYELINQFLNNPDFYGIRTAARTAADATARAARAARAARTAADATARAARAARAAARTAAARTAADATARAARAARAAARTAADKVNQLLIDMFNEVE